MMKRTIVIALLTCLTCFCFAQVVFEEISRDSYLAGNNYCVYPDKEHHEYTEAPMARSRSTSVITEGTALAI